MHHPVRVLASAWIAKTQQHDSYLVELVNKSTDSHVRCHSLYALLLTKNKSKSKEIYEILQLESEISTIQFTSKNNIMKHENITLSLIERLMDDSTLILKQHSISSSNLHNGVYIEVIKE